MALDGSGNFSLPYDFTTDKAGGIKPQAVRFDAQFTAIEEALDLALYRDGRADFTGDQSMGGFKLIELADPATSTDALSLGYGDARYLLKAQLASGIAVNASIACSVGSSELTVALKGADGNDPSSSNTVILPFRSATAGTGTITARSVTAATSIVINSTATLGTTNSTAFSLWVVAFDDGGTIRLGVINCLSGTSIYPLQQQGIASSTTEDNSSDSAHAFYTGTGVTLKPYIVLGRLIWNSGLATAGTWNAAPDVIVNMAPGVKLPNDRVQLQITTDSAVATGWTTIPSDDTIPQNTEGDQFMSLAATPTVAANVLVIKHQGNYASSNTAGNMTSALFQDSTANALAASFAGRDAASSGTSRAVLEHAMRAGTTSSTTFKIRSGNGAAGTTTFNGAAGVRFYGGTMSSVLSVEEIVA